MEVCVGIGTTLRRVRVNPIPIPKPNPNHSHSHSHIHSHGIVLAANITAVTCDNLTENWYLGIGYSSRRVKVNPVLCPGLSPNPA